MSSKKPVGIERRTSKRYGQSGEVRIVRQGTDIARSGQILDLSLGGCLVRVGDPSPFKKGMAVEVSIHLALVTFRAIATVRRVSEDPPDIGICFADIGRRARSELLDLMVELEAVEAAEQVAAALAQSAIRC
jgi:hypothetical protein